MKAVLLTEPGSLSVNTISDPTPAVDQIVVRVMGCGICGTDLHIIDEGLPDARYPLVPGHEPWGEVVAAGGPAGSALVGSTVAIDPSLPCGHCGQCWRGRPNLCEDWGAIGATSPGAWSEYLVAPVQSAHPLNEQFPKNLAVLVEPVACAIHGLDRLRPQPGDSALIVGAGTMGIILSILLTQQDVAPVVVADISAERRIAAQPLTEAEVVDSRELGDLHASLLVDATGSPEAIAALFDRAKPGATVMIFGVASPDSRASFSPYDIYRKELTVVGSMAILHSYDRALRAVQSHADVLAPLITHTYPLDEFPRAIENVRGGRGVKTVLAPGAARGGAAQP